MQLPQLIAEKLARWRDSGYSHEQYPAIAEILDWLSGREAGRPPFLRIPQQAIGVGRSLDREVG
ncbi:hypothetical protein [Pseudofulvimonas gallinarii]|jgi:hypothetical protein|uniref:Uncharacterized protein n=1 Tax=Pseudofulvimonas gallinarii TaxID=634155 RepID=A0A4R3LC07_9GAMM|nr:hypothetical protein [Pseudofulvimonas gallinarii]TCS97359.1 hypothetical protein EDC25_11332 [Pseudofulvimonas gallinarii]